MPTIITLPTATTVAGADPETAAKNALASNAAMASPPRKCPTSALANATMRRATPPVVMNVPARMKNGTANSGYTCIVWKKRWLVDSNV